MKENHWLQWLPSIKFRRPHVHLIANYRIHFKEIVTFRIVSQLCRTIWTREQGHGKQLRTQGSYDG